MSAAVAKVRVSIIGASGYTGAELVRILLSHPSVDLRLLVGHGKAGLPIAEVLPSLAGLREGNIEAYDIDRIASESDAVFTALPHGASGKIVAELRERDLVVFDLSADFRLHEAERHQKWYGEDHSPTLRQQAVYGLVELHRDAIAKSNLVAVPGCFPTASILPVAPLMKAGLVTAHTIIVDAKTGISGAGRSASSRTHYPEAGEGIRAYNVAGRHRHTAEIEQELSAISGAPIQAMFTPHLVPMTRGILSSSYLQLSLGVSVEDCVRSAREFYADSKMVFVHEPNACPDTLWVRGSNRVHIAYAADERTRMVLAQGAIDNLVKGAAGQAVQGFNLRFGFAEELGLQSPATWP